MTDEATLCTRCHKEPASGILPRGQVGENPLCLTCQNQEMAYRVGGRAARIGRLRVPPSYYKAPTAEAWLQGYDAEKTDA